MTEEDEEDCGDCEGTGYNLRGPDSPGEPRTCPNCLGSGKEPCVECGGSGVDPNTLDGHCRGCTTR